MADTTIVLIAATAAGGLAGAASGALAGAALIRRSLGKGRSRRPGREIDPPMPDFGPEATAWAEAVGRPGSEPIFADKLRLLHRLGMLGGNERRNPWQQ